LTSSIAVEGNIRQKSLREIWENSDGFGYNRHFSVSDLKGQCKGCFYGKKCRGGCNSQSLSFFGEFNHAPFCLHKIEEETKVHKYL
jgi:radical SAM protein with 4Fe4S-binding SPASM domain